jgi:uncharacterized membrane protein YkoI
VGLPAKKLKMKRTIMSTTALTLAVLAGAVAAEPIGGPNFRGHQLAGKARLSLSQARVIALKARPGAIADQELEKESGGSGLRYSFDILSSGKIYEVGVDARTGKILENDVESAAEGAAEH